MPSRDGAGGGTGTHVMGEADRAALDRIHAFSPRADPVGELGDVPPSRLPRHVAIIMDGNGRWAEQNGLPRVMGHRNGAASVREVVTRCVELGIEVLTLYSFSSENWSRPEDEVRALMNLCIAYFDGERARLVEENLRVRAIGAIDELPGEVRDAIRRTEQATASCTGPVLCLAINYGARAELIAAARSLADDARAGRLDPDSIDEATISARLDTAGLPDPDLLIRTGGDCRVSNFLLWQISYAEIVVTDTFWPEFGRTEFDNAIRAFAGRSRRFGGLDTEADPSAGEPIEGA